MMVKLMNKNKKSKASLLRHVFITLTAIIMLIAVIIFIDYQTDEVRIAYVNSVAKDNEFLLDTVTEKMSDFSTEDKAVDYLKSLPSTGTRYYFMLSPEKMVFERNTDSTLKIKDMSFDELVDYYTNNGGDGVSKFFSLIKNGNPFSATLIKDKTYGSELISINFVKINNTQYCIGASVSQAYIISTSKLGEIIFLIKIVTSIICIILIAVVIYVLFLRQEKSKEISNLENQLHERNTILQKQGEIITHDDIEDAESLYDSMTNLYNKHFFETVIKKLALKNATNIGLISIKILNLKELISLNEFSSLSEMYSDISSVLKKNSSENDVIARISSDIFTILKVNVSKEKLDVISQNFIHELKQSYYLAEFDTQLSFYATAKEIDLNNILNNNVLHS